MDQVTNCSLDILTNTHFIPESKVDSCVGKGLTEKKIGPTAVFIGIDGAGGPHLLSGAQVAETDIYDYPNLAPFTFPVIADGQYVQFNQIAKDVSLRTGSFPLEKLAKTVQKTGIYKVMGMFSNNDGRVFSFEIPLPFILSRQNFEMFTSLLTKEYGPVAQLACGDFDYSTYLGSHWPGRSIGNHYILRYVG
jgi:hypothetical protein